MGNTPAPVVVDIPSFGAPGSTAAPPTPPEHLPVPTSSALHTLGWIAGGVGVAAAAVGAGFGVAAFDAEARSRSACQGHLCTPTGVDLNHEARRDALVADVTFAGAGVALAAAVLLLTRGRSTSTAGAAIPAAHGGVAPSFQLRVGASAAADVGVTGSW